MGHQENKIGHGQSQSYIFEGFQQKYRNCIQQSTEIIKLSRSKSYEKSIPKVAQLMWGAGSNLQYVSTVFKKV